MFEKLAIRNIPAIVYQALQRLAESRNRSLEGEARQALQSWVEPELKKDERNSRRQVVAERLNRLLQVVNDGRYMRPPILMSHIAEQIGLDHAEEFENWFLGVKEPAMSQLDAIANHLGADNNWLKHGTHCVFPQSYCRLSRDPFEAVEWLTKWNSKSLADTALTKTLFLVRENSETGSLAFVKLDEQNRCQIFNTSYHVSEAIGAGGEGDLIGIFLTFELLYKLHTSSNIDVYGYQLDKAQFEQLLAGNTHPRSLCDSPSTWWEDIWDAEMYPKHDYWIGWSKICARIGRNIDSNDQNMKIRNIIRERKYERSSTKPSN